MNDPNRKDQLMSRAGRLSCAIWLSLLAGSTALGQGFSSGSDESDGALTFPANAGVVVFNPTALGIDADGDGVYHFTSVTVPVGTTVRLSSDVLGEGKPVVWLASGPVQVQGAIDLSGQAGHNGGSLRQPALAGAGGFSGGPGGTPTLPARPGGGPGGGATALSRRGGSGSFLSEGVVSSSFCAPAGAVYGNRFLLPLIGGSGGGGGHSVGSGGAGLGAGGGGGGGALLIASTTSIEVSGSIDAGGGDAGTTGLSGGGGSGGAVRLMAPDLTGTGSIDVSGGSGATGCAGAPGLVRLEAFRNGITSVVPAGAVDTSRPANVFLPANAPKVRISQIGSTTITTQNPLGSYVTPDATINEAGPVTITIQASNIPLGTQIQLKLCPEGGTPITVTTTALTGTVGASTATAGPLSIPSGFNRFHLVASWTP